jgi:hypothetical protein
MGKSADKRAAEEMANRTACEDFEKRRSPTSPIFARLPNDIQPCTRVVLNPRRS